MEKIFDSEFYSKLHKLRMSIAMRLASGMSGGRKSNAKGNSVEFSDFREYRLGDDFRRVDWNAYGRFDKLYVKLFMEEKEGIFNLFLDTSKSMDFGEQNKSVAALRIMAALSYVILDNSDRVYINCLGKDGLTESKGYAGRQAFPKITEMLENVSFEGEADLYDAMKHKQLTRRGMSVLVSDGYTGELEELFKYMKFKNQDIVFVHVLSPEEISPLFEGTVLLVDSENSSEMRMTMSSSMMKAYKNSYKNFIRNIEVLCKKYAVTYIPVSSADSLDSLFFHSLSKISKQV